MRLALGFGMLTAVAGHGESWPSWSPQAPPCLMLCTCFHLSLPLSCLPLPCLSLYLYGPGAMVQPRTRNSVEWQVGVNTQRCSNLTGDACNNGQAAFWYSQGTSSLSPYLQVPVNALPPLLHWKCTARARADDTAARPAGCFIGCPECDNESGRRQVDLCGLGKKRTLVDPKYWSVNRDAEPFSEFDVYQHNPWAAPGSAPVADACGLAGGSPSRANGAEAGSCETLAPRPRAPRLSRGRTAATL